METLKDKAIEFVENQGSATNSEIRKFMYETKFPGSTFQPTRDRGWFCSYFSGQSFMGVTGCFEIPSRNTGKFLTKHYNGNKIHYTVSQ